VAHLDRAHRVECLEHLFAVRPRGFLDRSERRPHRAPRPLLAYVVSQHGIRGGGIHAAQLLERRAVLAPTGERQAAACAKHALGGVSEPARGEHGGVDVGALGGG